ncbi:MAG: hypothetical protein KDG89_02930 [Geminicoccaceae bacterium]|nr:hypothetical protein [Geminicoccaceae bacterium]
MTTDPTLTPRRGAAGGAAAGGGERFRNAVAAALAVRVLAERAAPDPLGLGAGVILSAVGLETAHAVDAAAETSAGGRILVQAKRGLAWSPRPGSECVKTLDQTVRQLAGGVAVDGRTRPLDPKLDRLVIAVDPSASGRVRNELRTLLEDIAAGLPEGRTPDDPPMSQAKRDLLAGLKEVAGRAWQAERQTEPLPFERLLRLVRVLVVEDGGGDAERTILADAVLAEASEAPAVWAAFMDRASTLAPGHGLADRASLQEYLDGLSFRLRAARSLRPDIERLREESDGHLAHLHRLAVIGTALGEIVVERPVAAALADTAHHGHALVVGEAGAGKSGVLHAFAQAMRAEGHDVVVLAVERPNLAPDGTPIRGLAHGLAAVLAGWPGATPGFVVVDGLDAARSDAEAAPLRHAVEALAARSGRWRVVASIRKFDLRHGRGWQRLFKGAPKAGFADAEFAAVRHVDVGRLDDAELAQAAGRHAGVRDLLGAASPSFRDLLRSPFNLRLAVELLEGGRPPTSARSARGSICSTPIGTNGYASRPTPPGGARPCSPPPSSGWRNGEAFRFLVMRSGKRALPWPGC